MLFHCSLMQPARGSDPMSYDTYREHTRIWVSCLFFPAGAVQEQDLHFEFGHLLEQLLVTVGGGALEVLWEFTSSFGPCAVLPADLVSSLSSFVDFRFRYLSLLSFLGFKSGLTLSLLTFAPRPSFPTSSTSNPFFLHVWPINFESVEVTWSLAGLPEWVPPQADLQHVGPPDAEVKPGSSEPRPMRSADEWCELLDIAMTKGEVEKVLAEIEEALQLKKSDGSFVFSKSNGRQKLQNKLKRAKARSTAGPLEVKELEPEREMLEVAVEDAEAGDQESEAVQIVSNLGQMDDDGYLGGEVCLFSCLSTVGKGKVQWDGWQRPPIFPTSSTKVTMVSPIFLGVRFCHGSAGRSAKSPVMSSCAVRALGHALGHVLTMKGGVWAWSLEPFVPRWKKPNFWMVRVIQFQWKSEGETGKLSIFGAPQFLRDSHVSLVLLMLSHVFPWLKDTGTGASRGRKFRRSFREERTCEPKKELMPKPNFCVDSMVEMWWSFTFGSRSAWKFQYIAQSNLSDAKHDFHMWHSQRM